MTFRDANMSSETSLLLPLPTDDTLLMRRSELPSYIGISEQTLARWAHEGRGPKYLKLGTRLVAYRVGDVRQWLERQPSAP
jgi:predicted DNA-binding transcriptional regulator AlpA